MTRPVKRCICEWPDECDGSGVLYCEGCGGDQCVCKCHGHRPCLGCENCEFDDADVEWDDSEVADREVSP